MRKLRILAIIGIFVGISACNTQNGTYTASSPISTESMAVCTNEDTCSPVLQNGQLTSYVNCEDNGGQTPCITWDEDEWRLVTSYNPYNYIPVAEH